MLYLWPECHHRKAVTADQQGKGGRADLSQDSGPLHEAREISKMEVWSGKSARQPFQFRDREGGDRIRLEYCVTCHNPGSTDPTSGDTVDLTVMVHKIHQGEFP